MSSFFHGGFFPPIGRSHILSIAFVFTVVSGTTKLDDGLPENTGNRIFLILLKHIGYICPSTVLVNKINPSLMGFLFHFLVLKITENKKTLVCIAAQAT